MKLTYLLAGVAAVSLLAVSSASASGVYITYQGVVSTGFDLTGVFGAPNTVLDGQAFTATFFIDDSEGVSAYNPPLSSSYTDGPFATRPTGQIQIGGVSVLIPSSAGTDGASASMHVSAGAGGVWGVDNSVAINSIDAVALEFVTDSLSLGMSSTTDPFVTDFDYHSTLFHALQAGDVSQGALSISDRVQAPCGQITCPPSYRQFATANLIPLSVRVAVPEPATWAMMIVGFGLAGRALRRRRNAPAARAAA